MSRTQNYDPDYTLCCGGTDDDAHMVEMEFNPDAATPHWVCPECGSKSWVAEEQIMELMDNTEGER